MTNNATQNVVGFPMSPQLAIPIMLLAGVGIGFLNGSAVSRIGMPPLIVTLGMWEILKGISYLLCWGTSISGLPEQIGAFGVGKIAGVPNLVIIFIVVCAVAYFWLHHTTFGRSVYAVGGSPHSAWLSGINVTRITTSAYVISGFLAGLAGVMTTARMAAASMQTLVGLELDSIAAVAVGGVSLMGGKGSVIGVVIGVLLISTVNNAMAVMGADPAQVGIVRGAIIMGAVAVDYIRRRRA
jgi:ribose/xylose/arabinose/galactoside ABC-type transport system permease subunit